VDETNLSAWGAAMKSDRLVEWIDLVGDLLQRPQSDFPVEQIACQLNRTFSVHTVTWDWRERSGRSGVQMWPVIDLTAIAHLSPAIWAEDSDDTYHHDFGPIHARHPLVQWYAITQDPAPWSTGRVPASLAPRRDWQLIDDYLKPLGGEQQLSIPYLLDGERHGTFLLSRSTDDYRDDDVELAGHLQRLIRGLYLSTGPVARAAPGAAQSCASADRTGLTATELAVLIHLADGHTAYGIALRLQMAPRTASKHLEHIYRKLGVTNRLTAVTAAQEAGILTAAHPRLTSGPQHGALGDGEEQRG
jgi:DNA-binding CsgD family transcriptional regulator